MCCTASRVTLYSGGWKQGGHSLQLCGSDEGDGVVVMMINAVHVKIHLCRTVNGVSQF